MKGMAAERAARVTAANMVRPGLVRRVAITTYPH